MQRCRHIGVLLCLAVAFLAPPRAAAAGSPNGRNPAVALRVIRMLLEQDRYAEAKVKCYALLWEDIHQPEALYHLARCLDELGEVEQAAVFYHLAERELAGAEASHDEWNADEALLFCRTRLADLDFAHRDAAKQYAAAAEGKEFASPHGVSDLWMSQVECDLVPLQKLYLWPLAGGLGTYPARWIHNAQGTMHRSGAKHLPEVDGRRGVLFCTVDKDEETCLHIRNTGKGDALRIGAQGYNFPFHLTVSTAGERLFSGTVADSVWSDLKVPLGTRAGQDIAYTIELSVPADQPWAEGAYFDYIDFFKGDGPEVAPEPRPVDLRKGLIGHWEFEEGRGLTIADSSGYGHNGRVLHMRPSECWAAGCPRVAGSKYALNLDGTMGYAEVPCTRDLTFPQDIAVALWVKLDRLKLDNYTSIISQWNKLQLGGERWGFAFYYLRPVKLCFTLTQTANAAHCDYVSREDHSLATDTWYHLAVTWHAGTVPLMYKDGVAVPSKIGYGSLLAYTDHYWDVPIRIGYSIYHKGDGSNLDGQVDDVRIYDRPLSPQEVAALAGRPPGAVEGKAE